MSTIVKIEPSTQPGHFVIHNESKVIMIQMKRTDKLDRMLGQKRHMYAKAKITKSGEIEIKDLVGNQGW